MFSFLRKLNTISLEMMVVFIIFQACSSSTADTAEMIAIPLALTQENALDLTNASNITVFVTGCASGYVSGGTVSSGGTVNLPNKDKTCLVQLTSFTFNSATYSASGSNTTAFTTWLAGNRAIFQNVSNASDLVDLLVTSQVTQSGVLVTDTVSYNLNFIASTSTSNLSQANIVYSNSVSVTGDPAPNVSMLQARVLSANANGSFNMSFTFLCGASVTGTTPNFACSGVQMNTRFDYILIPDTYSQAPLTVAQLTAAFAGNTPTTVGSLVVNNGGSDLNSNVLATGGFYTSNASPLAAGSSGAYVPATTVDYVFMLRQKDAGLTNAQSFTYFYVVLPADTASGCGTSFTGGAGTSANPYGIASVTDLQNTVNCNTSSTYFIQVANIDLTGVSWTPIAMYGQYNGNNYSISNLSYTNAGTASAIDGLFSTIQSGASVSNLILSSFSISSVGTNVGALAGSSAGTVTGVVVNGGTITNTYSQAAAGTDYVGGLVGNMTAGSITTSGSSASVVGVSSNATTGTFDIGGLVGLSTAPSISSSYATGNISISAASATAKTINMGNLIGAVTSGTAAVTQNYSTGNITFPTGGTNTTLRMGSIAQFAPTSGSISYSFVKGTYTASSALTMTLGGMIGVLTSPATVNNSYTMVTFSTTGSTAGNLGGFVGTTSATNLVSLSYSADPSFSSTITTRNVFNGSGTAVLTSYYYNGATGLPAGTTSGAVTESSANMQLQGTFTNLTFGTNPTNWTMPTANTFSSPSGFLSPVLYWQCGANGISC